MCLPKKTNCHNLFLDKSIEYGSEIGLSVIHNRENSSKCMQIRAHNQYSVIYTCSMEITGTAVWNSTPYCMIRNACISFFLSALLNPANNYGNVIFSAFFKSSVNEPLGAVFRCRRASHYFINFQIRQHIRKPIAAD